MKKNFFAWILALMALSFASCLNQDDGSDVVNQYITMATVTTGGAHPIFQNDEGVFLSSETTMPADTFVAGERYFLQYTFADTVNHAAHSYPVELVRYGKTITKPLIVLPKDSTDLWYDKPIFMLNFWFSSHYCNFYFVSYAGMTTPNTFELVRMRGNESSTSTDTVPKLYFELRHNVSTISTGYTYYRFYSFDLNSLATEFPNAVRYYINISWNDANYGSQNYFWYYTPNVLEPGTSLIYSKSDNRGFSLTPF